MKPIEAQVDSDILEFNQYFLKKCKGKYPLTLNNHIRTFMEEVSGFLFFIWSN